VENPGSPSAADLVKDWLEKEFSDHLINFDARSGTLTQGIIEIMIDGVGVAELNGTILTLMDPIVSTSEVVSLAHPESLQFLSKCINNYFGSAIWKTIMADNKKLVTMKSQFPFPIQMLVVHRSSLGYNKTCK
jgi:hypothetical protein